MPTQAEIQDKLKKDIRSKDPSIDLAKGPIYDLLVRPVPPELAGLSESISSLQTLYSAMIASNPDNESMIDVLGRAFRVPRPKGRQAVCGVVFWTTSVTQPISIKAGSSVATADKSIIYSTMSDIYVTLANASLYFNPGTGRYEFYVLCVANNEGVDQAVPAYRLNTVISKLTGIQGCWNPNDSRGGVDASSYQTYLELIQSRFLARNENGFEAMWLRCLELYPEILVTFVSQDNRESFKRNVRGDAFDVVVAQSSALIAEDVFDAAQTVTLTKAPLLDIESVFLNDSVLVEGTDYNVIKDTSSLRDSAKSFAVISITRKLALSDRIRVRYNYCEYCSTLQSAVFSSSRGFFGYDALVRLAEPVDMYVTCTVNQQVDLDSVRALISGSLNSGVAGVTLTTQTLYDAVLSAYPNILMTFSMFNSTGTTGDVRPVSILQHQTSRILPVNLSVAYK